MNSTLLIEAHDLSYRQQHTLVIHNFNLRIHQGDFLVLTGANGCGKTTLLRLLLGLLKPTSGNIHYFRDGQFIPQLRIGYLPQQNRIDRKFPITVQEVIESSLLNTPSFTTATQRCTQAIHFMQQLEIEHLAKRLIGQLSGGELQRVLLARAIAPQPQVLFLDEPSTFVDSNFRERMSEIIATHIGRTALLVVTHHPDETLYASARTITLTHYEN